MGIKSEKRQKRALKTRSKIALTNNNRLTIFRSNSHIYAQITTNQGSAVLVSASSGVITTRSARGFIFNLLIILCYFFFYKHESCQLNID